LRMEDTFANAQWFGQQEVLDQKVLTVDEFVEELDAVTSTDVQEVSQRLFAAEQLNLAIVGPFKKEENFGARLRLH
jgi:predicted Zn-dependent peptidase